MAEKTNYYLVAIVAIVAIIAIVVMFKGTGTGVGKGSLVTETEEQRSTAGMAGKGTWCDEIYQAAWDKEVADRKRGHVLNLIEDLWEECEGIALA